MDEQQQHSTFFGWAVVEIFGHQKYAGYVTTETFGIAAMFRIDVPALEARERVTKAPGYVGGRYVPAGSKVLEGPVLGYTKLFGVGAVFGITPCTPEAARQVVEEIQPRPLMAVDVPPELALPEGRIIPDRDLDDDFNEDRP